MAYGFFKAVSVAAAAVTVAVGATSPSLSLLDTLPQYAREVLSESMAWMDSYYDASAGYLLQIGGEAALRHDTRTSVWYAVGLLARNHGDDAANANTIIANVIRGQYKVPSEQWYGTYQIQPEEPYVNSSAYPAVIYETWDPNWRGFVGTSLIMSMEEFPHLLTKTTKTLILESLRNATIGDSYRVGGVDDDNLYPAYSNPSIMRAFTTGWTGRRLDDANMTFAGEAYAQDIIALFDRANTLSEFNSGTYTGVSLFGLLLWSKYLPQSSVMAQHGPSMLKHTWQTISHLWHPAMKNMAGPWDRAYGYDMNRYVSLMGIWFWTLIGKDKSSLVAKPQVMSHMSDYSWAPLLAILAPFYKSLIPQDVLTRLVRFEGEHTIATSAYYPPYDFSPRNITTWISQDLTIGAESFNENVIGGPARSQAVFNPAVVQWNTGSEIGFISLYPTETALQAVVSPNKLALTYPNGNASSIFSLVVGAFKNKPTLHQWTDLPGLSVSISGNMNATFNLTYGGAYGGAWKPINNFEYWNFTYFMPSGFSGVPCISLELYTT